MKTQFKIIIQTSTGSEKWEVPYSSFNFNEELNNDRSANMAFDYSVVKGIADAANVTPEYIFSGSYRDAYILDDSGNTIYSGYISGLSFDENESDAGTISVQSKGFWSLLSKRLTNVFTQYTSVDISYIIIDLLNYTQGLSYGNLGITVPTLTTTRNMTWQVRYENIKDFIHKLTNAERSNAIDFEIDNSKTAVIYYPQKGTQRDAIILEEGFNIIKYTYKKYFVDDMVNRVLYLGGNTDQDTQLVSVQNAEDVYKSNFFLLESKESSVNTIDQTELDSEASQFITYNKAPRPLFTISHYYENPTYTNYSLGDRLRIKIPKYSINDFYRVWKRSVNDKGNVDVTFFSI